MSTWKRLELTGWGRTSGGWGYAARPETWAAAAAALQDESCFDADDRGGRARGLIAYGAGRSYGDAALNPGGRVLLTTRLDRILAFDSHNGDIVTESGVSFQTLLQVFLPRGFLIPIAPGTSSITLGGAVAHDIHGKNQEADGSFGDHVQWLELLLPTGQLVRCSRTQERDLFHATIGGIGLTGVILAVGFRMKRVGSNAIEVHERRMANLDEFLAAFSDNAENAPYSVGWIDGLATGAQLGRGILQVGRPSNATATSASDRRLRVPFDCPTFVLNRFSIGLFNALYYRRVPPEGRQRVISYEQFFFPLDSLTDWNRIYGRPGFYQFQCVIPPDTAPQTLRRLLEMVAASGKSSFLAVLKAFGSEGPGWLSFPMQGYTLALDLPASRLVRDLISQLHQLTLEAGGRIYLAKDATLDANTFAAMYQNSGRFKSFLQQIDPQRRMSSAMARRLGLHEGAA